VNSIEFAECRSSSLEFKLQFVLFNQQAKEPLAKLGISRIVKYADIKTPSVFDDLFFKPSSTTSFASSSKA
jgi:hypothetical protein